MRLLKTSDITLHEFGQGGIPDYAILSHRWTGDEISFQSLTGGLTEEQKQSSGYKKIVHSCRVAKENDFEWIWIDTCCIDKSSSAELSESINSMYQWYRSSVVCFAYLNDAVSSSNYYEMCQSFRGSEWFYRGWTLQACDLKYLDNIVRTPLTFRQELLAPPQLVFFDHSWEEIGTRKSLEREVSEVTGIPARHLNGIAARLDSNKKFASDMASVAQIMSWASGRKTTRVEDEAYCLLGLFRVNMPLLYGEGSKAFMRLQLEIIKQSDDESIFAWSTNMDTDIRFGQFDTITPQGLLSPDVRAFESCGDVRPHQYNAHREPYTMTNRGLQMKPILARPKPELVTEVLADFRPWRVMLLNCERDSSSPLGGVGQLGILLDEPNFDGRLSRLCLVPVAQACSKAKPEPADRILYVQQPEHFHSFRELRNLDPPVVEQDPDETPKVEQSGWRLSYIGTTSFKCGDDQFGLVVGLGSIWSGLGFLLIPDHDEFAIMKIHDALRWLGPHAGAFATVSSCFSDRATQLLSSGASISVTYKNRPKKQPTIHLCYKSYGQVRWPERERLSNTRQVLEQLLDGSLTGGADSSTRRLVRPLDKRRSAH